MEGEIKIKKCIAIILILTMILLSVTSCGKAQEEEVEEKEIVPKDAIQLWIYQRKELSYYSFAVRALSIKALLYCKDNNIPFQIVTYYESAMTYDEFEQKRNAAMANGNIITIDDANNLSSIAKHHADYTKVENYNNLFDIYKNQFCIPLGIGYVATGVKEDIFDYYDVMPEKRIITYDEYLQRKQAMKEKGARFTLNEYEWKELIDYYLVENDLYGINDDSEVIKDKDTFSNSVKNAILGICNDLNTYYTENKKNVVQFKKSKSIADNEEEKDEVVYDTNSQINILGDIRSSFLNDYYLYLLPTEEKFNNIFIIKPEDTPSSPCVYIYKKVKDERIYDIASALMDEKCYRVLIFNPKGQDVQYSPYFSPTQNTDEIKRYCQVNNNWEYNGIYMWDVFREQQNFINMVDSVNKVYKTLFFSGEASEKNARYYFNNKDYNKEINEQLKEIVIELVKENNDIGDKENKVLDKKIKELVSNVYVHFNL